VVSNLNNIGLPSAFSVPGTSLPVPALQSTSLLSLPATGQSLSAGLDPLSSFKSALYSIRSTISAILSRPGGTGALPKPAGAASTGKPLNIVQIDDFSTDKTGFNHGQEIANTLSQDGNANIQKYDISKGGNRLQNISNALDDVIAKAQNGESIDAVNLSQQDLDDNSPIAQEIRSKIDTLSSLGVPVAVAAGNGGPGKTNSLAGRNSFNVASTTNGAVNGDSGRGNVTAEGRTTSFATANFALQLAEMHAQGYTSGQLLNMMA